MSTHKKGKDYFDIASQIVHKATTDAAYRAKLSADPIACFAAEGVTIDPEHHDIVKQIIGAQLIQFETVTRYKLPVGQRTTDLTPVSLPDGEPALMSADNYVSVSAQPWGVVFELSNQAVSDLQLGAGGVAAVLAAAAAVSAPGGVPAVVLGILSGFLAASAAVLGLVNRGKGVYITILWTIVACPCSGFPVPTPVL